MVAVQTCCFCAYTGDGRTFRNAGVDGYRDDVICHLCDTGTGDDADGGNGDVARWETDGGTAR